MERRSGSLPLPYEATRRAAASTFKAASARRVKVAQAWPAVVKIAGGDACATLSLTMLFFLKKFPTNSQMLAGIPG